MYRHQLNLLGGQAVTVEADPRRGVVLTLSVSLAAISFSLTEAQAAELYGAIDVALDRLEDARNDAADWAAMSDDERAQVRRDAWLELEASERCWGA